MSTEWASASRAPSTYYVREQGLKGSSVLFPERVTQNQRGLRRRYRADRATEGCYANAVG